MRTSEEIIKNLRQPSAADLKQWWRSKECRYVIHLLEEAADELDRLTEENEALRKEVQATLAQLGEYSLDCQLLARWVREIAPQSVRETADKWVPDRGEGS